MPTGRDAAGRTPPVPDAAGPATATATNVTGTAAVLNANVNPMGDAAMVYFIYGTDPTLSAGTTTTASQSIGGGTGRQIVTATLSGLQPGATYYYRIVVTSAAGTTAGDIVGFKTPVPPPIVTLTSGRMKIRERRQRQEGQEEKALYPSLQRPHQHRRGPELGRLRDPVGQRQEERGPLQEAGGVGVL